MHAAYAAKVNQWFAAAACRRYGPPPRPSAAQARIGRDSSVVDIFDEVDEELRAERAQQLLKRYSGLIIAAVLLIVAAVGGWQAWNWWQAKQDVAAGQRYLATMALMQSPASATSTRSPNPRRKAIARLPGCRPPPSRCKPVTGAAP
jgi:hypothetical protein